MTQVETTRRVWVGLILQLSAFQKVRSEMFSFSPTRTDVAIYQLVGEAVPFLFKEQKLTPYRKEVQVSFSQKWLLSVFSTRYPALISLNEKGVIKKNFEVTQVCRFPFLR
jgi:hypothetical protein